MYNENIQRALWNNVPLLNDQKMYTVITDGKETMKEYFTSIMIFDEDQNDCLAPDHLEREALLTSVALKMKPYKW